VPHTSATRLGIETAQEGGYDQINPTGFRDRMRDLLLDPQTFRVTFREQSVLLTRIEFRLLEQLLGSNGGFLDRQDLLRRVWGTAGSRRGSDGGFSYGPTPAQTSAIGRSRPYY
jgi:hypothetical protein